MDDANRRRWPSSGRCLVLSARRVEASRRCAVAVRTHRRHPVGRLMPPDYSTDPIQDVVRRRVSQRPSDEPETPPDAVQELFALLAGSVSGRRTLAALAGALQQPSQGVSPSLSLRDLGAGWSGDVSGFVPWHGQPSVDMSLSRGGPNSDVRIRAGRDPYAGINAGVSGSVRWGRR